MTYVRERYADFGPTLAAEIRLVKDLRLAGISDRASANDYLPSFMARFNERFATQAARPDDLHRPLSLPKTRLGDVLAWRE